MDLKRIQIKCILEFSLLPTSSKRINLLDIVPNEVLKAPEISAIRWKPWVETRTDEEILTEKLRRIHLTYHHWHGEHTGYEYEENINYDTRYKDAAEIMIAFIPAIQSVRRAQYLRKTGPIARYFPDFV